MTHRSKINQNQPEKQDFVLENLDQSQISIRDNNIEGSHYQPIPGTSDGKNPEIGDKNEQNQEQIPSKQMEHLALSNKTTIVVPEGTAGS